MHQLDLLGEHEIKAKDRLVGHKNRSCKINKEKRREREKKAEWVNETPGSDNRSLPAADTPALGEWAGCGWAKAELLGLSIIRSSRTH